MKIMEITEILMNSDKEHKWHGTDYYIQEEDLADAPAPNWSARFWLPLVATLVIGIVAALAWPRQTRPVNGDNLWGQASEKDIGLIEDQLREFLPPRQIGEDPTQRQLSAELAGKAKLLLARGNDEQNALAKVALKSDNGMDATLNALKREPIAQTFRLLTLEGHRWYSAGAFDRAVEFYEQALDLQPEDVGALRNAAIAHSQARQGDITAHRTRAIELLEHGLEQVSSGSAQWCELQNNLGLVWMESIGVDRSDMKQAISAFSSAQDSRACGGNQALWATLQNNLGTAWMKMSTGDRASNLNNAIAAFRSALEVYTSKEHPQEWAMAQNNLDMSSRALADLRVGDVGENLAQAAAVFRSALEVIVREEHPVEWAEAQNNLGLALDHLSTGDPAENRRQAIAAFQAAEKAYSRTLHPMQWASTRLNQAVALKHLADTTANGCEYLSQASAKLKSATSVWPPEASPVSQQSQVESLTQALRAAWRTRDCGMEKTLEGIQAAK